jgi:hypothetical protein
MLEKMADFFTARVDEYDNHMMNDVVGCKEGYINVVYPFGINLIILKIQR